MYLPSAAETLEPYQKSVLYSSPVIVIFHVRWLIETYSALEFPTDQLWSLYPRQGIWEGSLAANSGGMGHKKFSMGCSNFFEKKWP